MGPDCCRTDYDALFNDRAARRELSAYRRKGAGGTTARLLSAIRESGAVSGASVLDIGGGVGVIGSELLEAGASALTDVDYSRAYLAAARSEVERRGHGDRATFVHGDFVRVADAIEPADVVTLDRVLCCYVDWVSLVDRSVERARQLYGLVYPVDRWWMRLSVGIIRGVTRLFGQVAPFRVHPERAVDARIRAAGFEPILEKRGFAWQTVLYRRTSGIAKPLPAGAD
jgi:magnesium-protoporphyrin O-methyltransferase